MPELLLKRVGISVFAAPQRMIDMKNKILIGIAVTLLGGLFAVCAYFGIRTLIRKQDPVEMSVAKFTELEQGEWVTFRAKYALESASYTVKHSINGVIPTGTEYYYAVFTDDASGMMIIRADKNWYSRNFDDEGVAKDEDGCLVTGFVRSTPDGTDRTFRLYRDKLQQSYKITISLQADHFVDTIAVKISILQIIIGVIPFLAGIIFLVCFKTGLVDAQLDSRAGKTFLIILILGFMGYAAVVCHFLSYV